MASSGIKFNTSTPAAKKLLALVFDKLKEVFDPTLADDAIAQYVLAVAARGSDKKKMLAQIKTILGPDASTQLLDWWVLLVPRCWFHGARPLTPSLLPLFLAHRLLKYIKTNKNELVNSQPLPQPVPAAG